MKKKNQHVTPWKDFAQRWQKLNYPPGAPSKKSIANYRNFINQARKKFKTELKILIFGATPQLRDLAQEFTKNVTLVDINWEMLMGMTQIVKKPNNQETWIKADWLDMPVKDQYFHIALGDMAITNVEYKNQDKFLNEASRVLAPKGFFISKVQLMPVDWPYKSVEEVLNKFKNLQPTKQRAMEVACMMINNTYNRKKHEISCDRIKTGLKKYFKHNKFSHPNKNLNIILNWMWEMWQPMEKVWSIDYEKNIDQQFNKHFKILDKKIQHDCTFRITEKNFPIYFTQKR